MNREAIYVRLGALAVALCIAGATTYFYARTATVVGAFLRLPMPRPHADDGIVYFKVLPAKPDGKPAGKPKQGQHGG